MHVTTVQAHAPVSRPTKLLLWTRTTDLGMPHRRLPLKLNGRNRPIVIIIHRGSGIIYINATSTREYMFRTNFAAECR